MNHFGRAAPFKVQRRTEQTQAVETAKQDVEAFKQARGKIISADALMIAITRTKAFAELST